MNSRIKGQGRLSRLRKALERTKAHLIKMSQLVLKLKRDNDDLRKEVLKLNMDMMAMRYALIEEGELALDKAGYVLVKRKQTPDMQTEHTPAVSWRDGKATPVGENINIKEVVKVEELWMRTEKPESFADLPTLPQSGR